SVRDVSSFVYACRAHPDLPSFPTRRSSDLERAHHGSGRVELELFPARELRALRPRAAVDEDAAAAEQPLRRRARPDLRDGREEADRKSTRLNSSHGSISYAVFCLKKKRDNK